MKHIDRKKVIIHSDGNCFYRAISLWKDGTSDEGHVIMRKIANKVIEDNPGVFEQFLFNTNSVTEHLEKSINTGTWAETVDIMACATWLQRPILVFSFLQSKWLRFQL